MRNYPSSLLHGSRLEASSPQDTQARLAFLSARRSLMFFIVGVHSIGMDIQVEVSALKYSQLSSASSGEPSSEIRKRVIAARQIQEDRYREYPGIHCNAQMTDRLLHQHCVLDEETNNTLQMAMERLHLSARAYSRILKVARTIADLEGKENVQMSHIAEAIGYRNLDRGDWAER